MFYTRSFYKSADHLYRVHAWDDFGWLVHGFGTRHSDAFPPKLATMRQIHSAQVVHASGKTGSLGEGDALIEDCPGTLLGIKTADCVPILLVDAKRRAIAAVHAGWRGTAQHIVSETVAAMVRTFGSTPEDLHAAIGPGIGKCCFEVGPEVARELGEEEVRRHIDLTEINRRQLLYAGLYPQRIYSAALCTVCNPEDFFSYRKEREHAGRMLSVVGLKCEGREKALAPGETIHR